MNWVDYLPYAFFGLAILVLLVAIFALRSARKAAAKHDEEQRRLALAVEEERRSEEAEAARDRERRRAERAAHKSCDFCAGELVEWECELLRPIETDGPTDRPYLRREWT